MMNNPQGTFSFLEDMIPFKIYGVIGWHLWRKEPEMIKMEEQRAMSR